MTSALWAAFGMTIGAAVLHAALGLPRPRVRTHLWFACIMVTLAAYVFFEGELSRSTTSEAAVETVRKQMIAAHGLIAFVLVFVPAYTQIRLPRGLAVAYGAGLLALFVTNIVARHGIWYSAEPHLVASMSGGVTSTAVVAPPPSVLQYLHASYVLGVFALTFTCALVQVRRGERRRGSMLAISLVVVILLVLVDVIRDVVGGAWPYISDFGLVTWGLIMSVQLAIDYRIAMQRLRATLTKSEQHAAELARTAEAALHVRDKLNTPLQTLELSLAVRTPRTPQDEQTLVELRGAVTRISELSRAVEGTISHPGALSALERAS
jgi:hypothetical protein